MRVVIEEMGWSSGGGMYLRLGPSMNRDDYSRVQAAVKEVFRQMNEKGAWDWKELKLELVDPTKPAGDPLKDSKATHAPAGDGQMDSGRLALMKAGDKGWRDGVPVEWTGTGWKVIPQEGKDMTARERAAKVATEYSQASDNAWNSVISGAPLTYGRWKQGESRAAFLTRLVEAAINDAVRADRDEQAQKQPKAPTPPEPCELNYVLYGDGSGHLYVNGRCAGPLPRSGSDAWMATLKMIDPDVKGVGTFVGFTTAMSWAEVVNVSDSLHKADRERKIAALQSQIDELRKA